jgi:hypothetical protein
MLRRLNRSPLAVAFLAGPAGITALLFGLVLGIIQRIFV